MSGISTHSWQQELKTKRDVSRLEWRKSRDSRTSFWGGGDTTRRPRFDLTQKHRAIGGGGGSEVRVRGGGEL